MDNGEQNHKLNFPDDQTEVEWKVTDMFQRSIVNNMRLRKKLPPSSLE